MWKSTAENATRSGLKEWNFDLLNQDISQKSRRQLTIWLGACSAWVFSLVVIGGVTRLTRSGLSMTDWKFTGERPPFTHDDWLLEFKKYKSSPEWQMVNRSMTLEEFKFIYYVEYSHRMWGRALGVIFAIPAGYFLVKKTVSSSLGKRLGIVFLMGGAQGLVGWWMVRSGLQSPKDEYTIPRVSPYRLAMHLMSAFSIYALLVWTTMSVASPNPILSTHSIPYIKGAQRLRYGLLPLSLLVAMTAASGAFVAGLEAGHSYNTFPMMNGSWVPEEYSAIPGWRNFFENTAAVQFNHRLLALTTLTATGCLWLISGRLPLPRETKLLMRGILLMSTVQVSLGVATLLNNVPVSLGAMHQSGALMLFTLLLGALHTIRSPQPTGISRLAARYGPDAIAVTVLASMGMVIQSS